VRPRTLIEEACAWMSAFGTYGRFARATTALLARASRRSEATGSSNAQDLPSTGRLVLLERFVRMAVVPVADGLAPDSKQRARLPCWSPLHRGVSASSASVIGRLERSCRRSACGRQGGPGVHLVAGADDAVQRQHVRGHRVRLIVGKRVRLLVGHRAADVIEHGRRIGPIAPDSADRRRAGQRPVSSHEAIVWATRAALAVTRLALRGVDGGAIRRRPATGRQAPAVRRDADVPPRDLGCRGRTAEIRRLRPAGGRTRQGTGRRRRRRA
jgi:hypothetical protein